MLSDQEFDNELQFANDATPLGRLDVAFARFTAQHFAPQHPQRQQIQQLLGLISHQLSQGHSCLNISDQQAQLLLESGVASDGQTTKPVVIEHGRAYLHRYWQYEKRLAQRIAQMARQRRKLDLNSEWLERVFSGQQPHPQQRLAAETALNCPLTLISGGPGTGKTTTVVRILALLQACSEPSLHIALCAPTGKAAMRLQESIQNQLATLSIDDDLKARIPRQVTTVHQLLGARRHSPYFKHNAAQPLPHDLVVVDETSMVDLALMSKLVDALKPTAGLLLLGDRQQLASVETGAVLAELCDSLPDNTVELTHSHRFDGPIKALADAINHEQAPLAWQLLQQQRPVLECVDDDLGQFMLQHYAPYFEQVKQQAEPASLFAAFNRFRVICANRFGEGSLTDLNYRLERLLASQLGLETQHDWYCGKPILLTANRPHLQLFNGDLALCLPDPQQTNSLKLVLQSSDGSLRWLHASQLPAYETAYATTIHKSQGSEFDHVLISLPKQINPVLSKQLLYTGVTRARQRVSIAAAYPVFAHCILHSAQRGSGLAAQIRTFGDRS